jgi:hypothetical protein
VFEGSEEPVMGAGAFERARRLLGATQRMVDEAAAAQRRLLGVLLEMWAVSAWRMAGAHSAQSWLAATTSLTIVEARKLVRIARVCHAHPTLADAVLSGPLSLGRADVLTHAVTPERGSWLAPSLPALLAYGTTTGKDEDFVAAVRHWADLVDQELTPRRPQPHYLSL